MKLSADGEGSTPPLTSMEMASSTFDFTETTTLLNSENRDGHDSEDNENHHFRSHFPDYSGDHSRFLQMGNDT